MQRAATPYPHGRGGALAHAQMHGNGHVAQRGNDVLEEEDETESVEGGAPSNAQSRRLPPMSAPPGPRSAPPGNAKPLPRRARSSRKQRRQQVCIS